MGSSPKDSYQFQSSWKSVKGFRRSGGLLFPISLVGRLYNIFYRTSPDNDEVQGVSREACIARV